MATADFLALHGVLLAFLRSRPYCKADLADLFDLLGRLTEEEKRAFWAWLDQRDRNLKQWLVNQGNKRRVA